jgi:anti-sigma factor RsiW
LKEALTAPALYHRAPAGLQAKVEAALGQISPLEPSRPRGTARRLPTVVLAASVAIFAASLGLIGFSLARAGRTADDLLAQEVLSSHVRSLQAMHLTDIESSDRHVVKPWFSGKLDASPAVHDLKAHGYPLAGGRLDYLDGRPVAALVYRRRAHVINLFTWPAAQDGDGKVRTQARQGFNVMHWAQAGMNYWAVSDLNQEELQQFIRLVQDPSLPPPM